jgi:hypothetical protein
MSSDETAAVEPMPTEQLDQLRRKANTDCSCCGYYQHDWEGGDVFDLVVEVDRLRDLLAAYVERESADAAAGSYAGRAEAAEARAQYFDEEALRLQRTIDEARKQRDDWHDEASRQRARAEQAEAEVARLREANAATAAEYDAALLAIHEARDHWQDQAAAGFERAEQAEAALAEMREANGNHPRCCTCGKNLGYRNYRSQLFCWPCADGESPEARTVLERAADEQGVRLPVDIGKLTAGADLQLTDEEFAEWTSAWQCTAPCCSEDVVEQGDGGGGGDE